jgi:glycosyltransferase involved in cell wall biosynthesis
MSPVLISVLMTTLNSEKYLVEAIESILNQTFRDFELIIVDGGSTDKTIDLINKFQDNRIKLFKGNGLRRSAQLNYGINKSKGKYIAIMDSDDIALPDRLKVQFDYIESNKKISVVGSWAYLISEDGLVHSVLKRPLTHKTIIKNLIAMNGISFPTTIWEKTPETQNIFFNNDLQINEDIEWYLKMLPLSNFSNLPVCLMKLRQTKNSRSRSGITKDNNLISSIEKILSERIKNSQSLVTKAFNLRNLGLAHYYYGDYKSSKRNILNSFLLNPFSLLSIRYLIPLILPEKKFEQLRQNVILKKSAKKFRNFITWQSSLKIKKS